MRRKKKSWTCLFYLCGDNYLEPYIAEDFREICRAGAAPQLHVAVQLDRPAGAARYILPERALRKPPVPCRDLGNVNTGDADAAIDFLTWGMQEFPSTHLAVIMGGLGIANLPGQHPGVGDFADDPTRLFSLFHDATSKDALDAAELRRVFAESLAQSGRERVDVLGLDTCSVAFLEVAYQLEGLAALLVAPQTVLPGEGWPYDQILTAWQARLRRRGGVAPQALAQLLVECVVAAYSGHAQQDRVALSAINLAALDRVARALDTLTLGLLQNLGDWAVFSTLQKTRAQVQGIDWPENVDLLELLRVGAAALSRQHAIVSRQKGEADFGESERAQHLLTLMARARDVIAGTEDESALIVANHSLTTQPLGGISIHFPQSLAGSNYLRLRFAQKVHWAALLGAINLIEDHPRALWRLVSALMAEASGATRQQLIERMLGPDSVMVGLKEQFRALDSPPCLTLSLERREDPASGHPQPHREYCVRLQHIEAGATIAQRNCRVNPVNFDNVLLGLERLLNDPNADAEALPRIASLGKTLGEDLLLDLNVELRETFTPMADRDAQPPPHLRLQIAAELMRYPWELVHDGEDLLGMRYALGRQVFMDAPTVRRARGRSGTEIRVLVIGDPQFSTAFRDDLARRNRPVPRQLPAARTEAELVALTFEHLRDELAGLPPLTIETIIGQSVTVAEMRDHLRAGYHIIHFAGHAAFRGSDPQTSAWLLSDGELWAGEIRNTLAAQEVPPWLIFANACEAGMDAGAAPGRYQGDVFGLATAFINQGVAAYIAPLWPVQDTLAADLAADFYRSLLLDRASLGEALRQAKHHARARAGDAEAGSRRLTWAAFVLYGDPTPQLLRTLRIAPTQPRPSQTAAPDKGLQPAVARSKTPQTVSRPRKGTEQPRLWLSQATVRTLATGPDMRTLDGDGTRSATTLTEGEVELQLVEKNGVRYWQTVAAQGTPQPLGVGSRLAQAAAAADGERGLGEVLRIAGRWAVGVLTGRRQSLITELARQYDRDTVPEQRLVTIGADGRCTPFGSWDWLRAAPQPGQTNRVLLFVHGTFSQTSVPVADWAAEFLAWAQRTYRGVLGFDHWTLSETPEDNARLLWSLLDPALHADHRLDIVTHSRGGLVARALVELSGHGAAVRRVVFVGTPNAGTNLANPDNWGTVADVLINCAHLSPLFAKLSGFLARLLVGHATGQIPGLQAQNPTATGAADFLGRLQRSTSLPPGVSYSAVAASYEPEAGEFNLKSLLAQASDLSADTFYRHANDLVVDTGSVWAVDTKPDYDLGTAGKLVPAKRLLLFNPDSSGVGDVVAQRGVHHNNLFSLSKTMEFLKTQLA